MDFLIKSGTVKVPSESVKDSCGCSFDIGGSLLKAAFVKNTTKKNETESEIGFCTFKHQHVKEALDYIKANGVIDTKDRAITTTGVTVRGEIKDVIERELGGRVINIPEVPPMVKGFTNMLKTNDAYIPVDESVKAQVAEIKESMKKLIAMFAPRVGDIPQNNDDEVFPCLISSLGTGCNLTKMQSDGKFEMIGGSNRAGKTFLGLSSLLLGTSDYREVIELAKLGDDSKITNYMRDLKAGDSGDSYELFPDDLRIFSFGKAIGQDLGSARKEDIARALLAHMCDDLGMTYYWVARANGCRSVCVCGGFVQDDLVRNELYKSFYTLSDDKPSSPKVNFHYLNHGDYLPALGCLLQNNSKTQQQPI